MLSNITPDQERAEVRREITNALRPFHTIENGHGGSKMTPIFTFDCETGIFEESVFPPGMDVRSPNYFAIK
jgi:hypothetical protein